jgi:hypothetical protein
MSRALSETQFDLLREAHRELDAIVLSIARIGSRGDGVGVQAELLERFFNSWDVGRRLSTIRRAVAEAGGTTNDDWEGDPAWPDNPTEFPRRTALGQAWGMPAEDNPSLTLGS